MPEALRLRVEWRGRLTLFLAAMLLWLLNHPLMGVAIHDARIYTILALHWLNPQAYARDPFFMFGSQDSLSLFSPLYAPLIAQFGLTVAAISVLLSGAVLWCVAAIWLVRGLMPCNWVASMAVLALATLSLNYSPNGQVFVLNEAFATARSLAFPLGGLALAACVRGRLGCSALFCLCAFLLHPLIGLWPLGVLLLWPLSWRQRWALLSLGILLLTGAMLAEIGPFARFDAGWEAILRRGTHDVFVESPALMRWSGHALQLIVLLVAARHTGGSAARLYSLAALVAAGGLLIAMGASYFWPSQLVIQAQLWRSMWLAAYLMPVALCHLLLLMIEAMPARPGGAPWVLMAVLAILFMLRDVLLYVLLLWWLATWLLRLPVFAHWLLDKRSRQLRDVLDLTWFPFLSAGLVLLALPGLWAELGLLEGTVALPFEAALPQLVGLLWHGGLGIGFALLAYVLFLHGRRPVVLFVVAALLLVAGWHWDLRSERDRAWEAKAAFGVQDEVRALIRPGDVVLSAGRVPFYAWNELRTANYSSSTQAVGMVFSREKTFELLRRTRHIQAAYAAEQAGPSVGPATGSAAGSPLQGMFDFSLPTAEGIHLLCKDEALDWLILHSEPSMEHLRVTHAVHHITAASGAPAVWAIACAELRAAIQ